MKVKYKGDTPIRKNGIDFKPGEEKEVASDLIFDSPLFIVEGKESGEKTSEKKSKKSSKNEE